MKTLGHGYGKWGWGLIIYCFLTYFICSFGNNTTQIACAAWEQMYGWDQTAVLALPTLGGWISVAVVYIISVLFSKGKVKLRTLILVDGILYSVALALWGVVTNFIVFALLLLSMYTTYVLWMQFANNTITSNWFPRKKGVVIGITTIGLVVGSGFGSPLFASMMENLGLTTSYLIMGGFGLVLTLVGAFVFPEYPEQRGCFPDNDKSMTREQAERELAEGEAILAKSPWTPSRMLTVKETWLVALSTGFLLMFATGAMAQMVPRLLAGGYSMDAAMSIMVIGAVAGCIGSYLCGLLDGKIGPKKAMIITLILAAVGAALNIVHNYIAICVSLAIIGAAMGGAANYLVSMTTSYWGRYNFQKAYGTLLTINQIVAMSGAAAFAYMAKFFGYTVTFVVFGILMLVSAIMVLPVKEGFVEKAEAAFAAKEKK